MTRIAIIRHGSTAWNKEGRMQGSTDIPLDEEGMAQAQKLAQRLAGENWHLIYTSHLQRARQTGEIVGRLLNIPEILVDDRLREVNGGLTEGTIEAERIARWGPHWKQQDLGMEQEAAVYSRGMAFMNELLQTHAGRHIIIVSHGSFIRHMLRKLAPHVSNGESLKNTSVTRFTVNENNWHCELYNCTAHLEGA